MTEARPAAARPLLDHNTGELWVWTCSAARPVYLFYPVPEVVALFLVKPEGAVYRVVAPRAR